MGGCLILGIKYTVFHDHNIPQSEHCLQFLLQIAVIIGDRVIQFNRHNADLFPLLQHTQNRGPRYSQIISDLFLVHVILIIKTTDFVDQALIVYDLLHFDLLCQNIVTKVLLCPDP